MIRVSIEVPDDYRYRLKPIVDLRQRFFDDGIMVGYDLKQPDLRIQHFDVVLKELERSPERRLATPTIVDERVDSAVVNNDPRVRSALAHPDVKLWLKRNTLRDYRINNEKFLHGRFHYRLLNDIPDFHVDAQLEPCVMPVTAEMASKIRLLPTVGVDRFEYYRNQEINWQVKRPIDVMFAGLVDYEVRGSDFWDGRFAESQAATVTGVAALPDLHRRAAVYHLTKLRHLRILIGQNRALQADLYQPAMMRSSISVSPWGFGEYAYRDYESILAGCVLIKPKTDYVETFAPDIYQSNKYYVACRPDFSDLPQLIEEVMSDRDRAVGLARRAREDMLQANSPDRIHVYYRGLFRQALGDDIVSSAVRRDVRAPILALGESSTLVARAEIAYCKTPVAALGVECWGMLTEDCTTNNSHDIRLVADAPAPAGLYRLRVAVRKRGRSRIAVQVHLNWKESLLICVDLGLGMVDQTKVTGDLFRLVHGPEVSLLDDGWTIIVAAVQLTDFVQSELSLVLYGVGDVNSIYYDGDGRIALDIAALDLKRVDMRTM